jgi:phage shock protein E
MQRTEIKINRGLFYPAMLMLMLGFVISADGMEEPSWLQQARDEARQDGYELITASELKALYESGKDFTIIDVRPEYEYRDGHLPHAKSLEFDLGDKLELKPDKQSAYLKLLGPDKKRTIVLYCRSFA